MICLEGWRRPARVGDKVPRSVAASGPGRRRALLAGLVLLAAAPAYAADDVDEGPIDGDWSQRITTKMKDSVGGAMGHLGWNRVGQPPPSETPSGCPTIALLPGTEVQRTSVAGTSDNQGVRYQFSLSGVGRECSLGGGRVTLKVGAEGRVLLGPAGAAGHFDVPIRVAVFDELSQKVVESRLFKVPATIPAGQTGVPFSFVSEAMTLPIPQNRARDFSIKVGIDGGGKGGAEPAKAKHARRRTPAAAQSASR